MRRPAPRRSSTGASAPTNWPPSRSASAYVDAQREYGLQDWDGDGLVEYAQKLTSTPGQHDGLFWVAKPGEPESPRLLGNKARSEGYAGGSGSYHGYHFRILTAQGKDARGGAYDYIGRPDMIGAASRWSRGRRGAAFRA